MDITRDWHDDEIKQLLKGQEETNTLLRRFLDRQEQLLDSNKSRAIEVREPAKPIAPPLRDLKEGNIPSRKGR